MRSSSFLEISSSARVKATSFAYGKGILGDRPLLIGGRNPNYPDEGTNWIEIWPSPHILQPSENEASLVQGVDIRAEIGDYRVTGIDKALYPENRVVFTGAQYRIDGVFQVNVNLAYEDDIALLPEVDMELAEEIVRQRGPSYLDLNDLVDRVGGIGPYLYQILEGRTIFGGTLPVKRPFGGFLCDRVEGSHLEEDSLTWTLSLREQKRP